MKSTLGAFLVLVVLGLASLLCGCTRAENEEDKPVEQTREHIVQTQDSVKRVREDLAQAREDVGQTSDELTGRARALADRAAEKSERLAEKLDGELSEARGDIQALSGESQLDLSSLFENLQPDQDLNAETVKNRLAWGTLILQGEVKSLKGQVEPATLEDLARNLDELTADLRALDDKPDSELPSSTVVDTGKGRKSSWLLKPLLLGRGTRCDYALVRGSIWKNRGGSWTPIASNRRACSA